MEKLVEVTIADNRIHLEESVAKVLKDYMKVMHRKFVNFTDGEEIIKDIENRIFEKMTSGTNKNTSTLSEENLKGILNEIGSIEDFNDAEQSNTQNGLVNRIIFRIKNFKLIRDSENRQIAGVCAGLAKYFGIDIVMIRILFGTLTAAGIFIGSNITALAIFLYLFLWISMPISLELKNESELLQESFFTKLAKRFERFINNINFSVNKYLKFVLQFLGFTMLATSILVIALSISMFIIVSTNPSIVNLEIRLIGFQESEYNQVLFLSLIIVVLLAFLASQIGYSLLVQKVKLRVFSSFLLIITITISASILLSTIIAKRIEFTDAIRNNPENYVVEEYVISGQNLDSLKIIGDYEVVFVDSDTKYVKVLANKYLQTLISKDFQANNVGEVEELTLYTSPSNIYIPELENQTIKIEVGGLDFEELSLHEVASANSENVIYADNMNIYPGYESSKINLVLDVKNLEMQLMQVNTLELQGNVETMDLYVSAFALENDDIDNLNLVLDGSELQVKNLNLDTYFSNADMIIDVTERVILNSTHATGKLVYFGNPEISTNLERDSEFKLVKKERE